VIFAIGIQHLVGKSAFLDVISGKYFQLLPKGEEQILLHLKYQEYHFGT